MSLNTRTAFGMKLGLSRKHASLLARLRTPDKIQDYINTIPINFELQGETNLSVAEAMRQNLAHCLEGAFVAACALWINGERPLLVNMSARNDEDHAVVPFRRGKHWGAISKSNHVWLRWREPVYRSIRELMMSYFHEYVTGATQTLSAYSKPLDLRRFDPALWVSNTKSCIEIAEALADAPHYNLLPPGKMWKTRRIDPIEVKAGTLLDYKEPKTFKPNKYHHHD